ncbi:MAG: toll/interleukin-1 receptor domain-containing protein [Methanobrevibacter sp.]|uniref:toll/interleukin-1 receptor domain-containing protein n=1 Tax=Methanobrevibacter sp. TaxID=66852 RepID=UPI0025F224D4|nr:toll/interleukin-1 receptor domain-containing protein [Methanobrevibacter sp.]MBQ6100447.1 toll/interleukin-1 receptor domain-containing protein [Methanobrevibacter sp.]
MDHDVYIYYDEKDGEYCDGIYNIFKQNNIKSWIKTKDMSSDKAVSEITDAIAYSKCFVVVLSKNSQKTNQIITETDLAFSKNIPIVALNIDGAELEGNLEFILETQDKIPSYPNTKKQLEKLVKTTSKIIEKPAGKVTLEDKYVDLFEKINPKKKENLIKKVLAVAIPIAVIAVLVYLFVIVPTGQHTTDDGAFKMNVTGVEVSPSEGKYIYTVYGESYNLPSNSESYFMNIKFMDKDGNLVYEVNSTADEFKSGKIWSGPINNNNADHIDFKLFDINDKMLSNESYVIAK